jgi:hypothetical protein
MKRRLEVVIRESDEKERIFMTNIEISRSARIHTFSNSDLGKKRLKEIGKDGKRIVKRVKKIEIANPLTISIGPRMLLVKASRKTPDWSEIEKKIISILKDSLRKKIDDIQILREDLSFKKVP